MKKLLLLAALAASSISVFAQAPGPGAGIVRTADGVSSVQWFQGCDPTGVAASTACFNAASAAMAGKTLRVPAGTWTIGEWDIPSNIQIVCDSAAKIVRAGSITSGTGWIDLAGRSNVTIDGCTFDGTVLTAAGFNRASITTAIAASLSDNSTIWIHGGSNIRLRNITVQHTAGYSVVLDASSANIDRIRIENSTFQDNRPFTFGDPGDENYGAWTGGILAYSAGTSYLQNVSISNNLFQRIAGHAIFWDAVSSNANRTVTESGNIFRVIGLDGILDSGINGLTQLNNNLYSIGFVSTSDADLTGTAKWYNGVFGSIPAVGIDTASYVINATRSGNTVTLVNGGGFDLDGFGIGIIADNHVYNPLPSDPDYSGTVAGQMGPSVFGGVTTLGENYTYGFNTGNTNGTSQGASDLVIQNNTTHGLGGGGVRVYGGRNVRVSGNLIVACGNTNSTTDHNFYSPITVGNIGIGANQRAQNVTVAGNTIIYSGSSGINAVFEDTQYGAFSAGDKNEIHDNTLIGALADFAKDSTSSSASFGVNTVTDPTTHTTSTGYNLAITSPGSANVVTVRNQLELNGGNTLSRWYSGLTPLTTSNLMLTASSSGALFLGNGTTTGSLWWGATQLISTTLDSFFHSLTINGSLAVDNARNGFLNSITDTGSSSLTLDSSRNFRGNSLSVGTASVAQTAAGLAIANDRTAYLSQALIGTNGSSPLLAIDSSNNHTGAGFYGGSSITGATQFVAVATTGTGCTTGAPCVNLGNLNNLVQSNAAGTVSFAAAVGLGGTVNATGLGALSGSGSLLCLDGSGFIRSSLCPSGATAPLLLGSTSFTGGIPLEAISAGAFDDVHDYSPAIGLLGAGATSQTAVLEYFHPYAFETLRRESGVVGGAVSSASDGNWESNGVTGMTVCNTAFGFGGHHVGCVGGAFYGLVNATNAQAWGINTYVSDIDRSLATSTFDYTHNHAGIVIGAEMDHQAGNIGSNVSGINLGVAYLGITHTTATSSALNFNVTGGGAANYWDYASNSIDGAAIVGLHIGHGNNGATGAACTQVLGLCTGAAISTNSQFIDIQSGPVVSGTPTTPMITRMWNDVNGQFNIITNQCPNPPSCSSGNAKFIKFSPIGNIVVDGTASQSSITASAGYIQSAEGFYSTSSLSNVINIPNGGGVFGSDLLIGPAAIASGSIPSGSGVVFGFNVHNVGGVYRALTTGNRAGYWEIGNGGASMLISSGTQTAGSTLSTMSTAFTVDVFGNVTIPNALTVSTGSSFTGITNSTAYSGTGNLTISGAGNAIKCAASCTGFQIGSVTIIDSSQNIINAGNGTFSGVVGVGSINVGGVSFVDASRNMFNVGSISATSSVSTSSSVSATLNISTSGVFVASGNRGVACSGTPTALFTTSGGIVTHC